MNIKQIFTKQFYKYYYHKIRREKPLDYIFFDAKVFLLLLAIFLIGLFTLFPYSLKLKIPAIESQTYILESILRIVSIFIGISFSFIILSFNVFYKYFGRYAFLDFFKIRSAKICLTLLITTILLLIYTISFFKETNNKIAYTDFLFVFSLVLSIISFFSIFPFFIKLLRSSQNREHISKLFNKIGGEEYIINNFLSRVKKDKASFYHKNPINLISEIGLSSIKEFDNNTFELINDKILSFFRDSVSKQLEKDDHIDLIGLYYNFTDLLSDFYELSIKEKNEKFSKIIVNTRFLIENEVLKYSDNKIFSEFKDYKDKYRHWQLNFDVEKYFKKAVQYNEDEICEILIDNYISFSSKSIVKLYPNGLEYTKEKHFETIIELDTTFEPLKMFSKFADILFTNKKFYLVHKIFNSFQTIEYKILDLETTNTTKCLIFKVIHNYKKDVYEIYLNSPNSEHIGYADFPFKNGGHIRQKINCNSIYFGLLEIVDLLFSKNKLNNVVVNIVKAEMFLMIREKDFDNILIIKTIEKFKKLSKQISKNDSDYKKDIYLKLEKYLGYIKEDLKTNKAPKELIKKIEKTLASFKHKEKFQKELDKKGFVSDERIT